MKRGFKTAARRLAMDVRTELGLDDSMPFDDLAWATLYGIPLLGIAGIGCQEATLRHFLGSGSGRWSAALVPNGTGQVIIFNSAHSPLRIKSNITHEAGHVLLEHPNAASVMLGEGCPIARELEDEANELAGELLLPSTAAHRLANRGASDAEAALMYGISIEMARWRLNATGARLVARRRDDAYRRSVSGG
jgi:hypothetical protein